MCSSVSCYLYCVTRLNLKCTGSRRASACSVTDVLDKAAIVQKDDKTMMQTKTTLKVYLSREMVVVR